MLDRVWPLCKHDFHASEPVCVSERKRLAFWQERFRDSQLSTCWAEKDVLTRSGEGRPTSVRLRKTGSCGDTVNGHHSAGEERT